MPEGADPLVPLRQTGGRVPLYCVHAVSGSAYAYTGLARLLGDDQPVYGFEAPGFGDGREPRTRLTDLSTEYADVLLERCPDQPYQLLGWSMGGVIAFDMAHRLRDAGARVPRLVIVDATLPWRGPLPPSRELCGKYLHDLVGIAGLPADPLAGLLAPLPDDVDPDDVFALVEKARILPEELDAEILADRWTVFRAHIEALYDYHTDRRYPGPVTVVNAGSSPPERVDWETLADDVTTHLLPGDHHSIWAGDNLAAMTRIVADDLVGVAR